MSEIKVGDKGTFKALWGEICPCVVTEVYGGNLVVDYENDRFGKTSGAIICASSFVPSPETRQGSRFYVFIGDNPQEWSEIKPLGSFGSVEEAREEILKDAKDTINDTDMLSPGLSEDWFEPYHIMEVVEVCQPVVEVKTKVSLRQ